MKFVHFPLVHSLWEMGECPWVITPHSNPNMLINEYMGSYIRGNAPSSGGAHSHDIKINLFPSRLPMFVQTSSLRDVAQL